MVAVKAANKVHRLRLRTPEDWSNEAGAKHPGRVVSKKAKLTNGKTTAAEMLERIAVVAGLMVQGLRTPEICRYVSDETKWGVCDRTVERYMREARVVIVDASKQDISFMRAILLGRYEAIFQLAIKKGDLSNANQATRNAAKLLGLNAPDTITLQESAEPVRLYIPKNNRDDPID